MVVQVIVAPLIYDTLQLPVRADNIGLARGNRMDFRPAGGELVFKRQFSRAVVVEIEGEIISNGEQWRINTASGVIIDQLHNIEKAMIKQGVEDRSFTCVFKRSNKCIKMFPVEEKNNVGNSEQ